MKSFDTMTLDMVLIFLITVAAFWWF